MTRLFAIVLLVFASLLPAAPAPAADLEVGKVRLGQHGQRTRLVLETSAEVSPKVFTLPSPPRVVIDLPETRFKQALNSVPQPPGSLVSGMREGHFTPTITRMVLDMKRPVAASLFTIPATRKKPFRVVVDITPGAENSVSSTRPPSLAAPRQPQRQITPPPAHIKQEGPIIIMIDPGHGGVDPGAVAKRRVYEKNVVLRIAQKLRDELNTLPGVKAYLTRDRDVFVRLADRVRKAQEKHADLFISLHADAHRSSRVNGGSVYVLSEKASDSEARRLARNANEGDLVAGLELAGESTDVQNILIDLAQRETMNKSVLLAQELLSGLGRQTKLRKKHVMFAGFRVLKAPEIPSALVELSYLSNPGDRSRLTSSSWQKKIARELSRGVESYIKKHMTYRSVVARNY